MIFVDSSAVVAILADEPEADRFLDLLAGDGEKITGAHVRLECSIVLARKLGLEVDAAEQLFDDFLIEAGIRVVAITDSIGRGAVLAYCRFGKGQGHRAQLNFGDCLSYACASEQGAQIVFKGDDFVHTDLKAPG